MKKLLLTLSLLMCVAGVTLAQTKKTTTKPATRTTAKPAAKPAASANSVVFAVSKYAYREKDIDGFWTRWSVWEKSTSNITFNLDGTITLNAPEKKTLRVIGDAKFEKGSYDGNDFYYGYSMVIKCSEGEITLKESKDGTIELYYEYDDEEYVYKVTRSLPERNEKKMLEIVENFPNAYGDFGNNFYDLYVRMYLCGARFDHCDLERSGQFYSFYDKNGAFYFNIQRARAINREHSKSIYLYLDNFNMGKQLYDEYLKSKGWTYRKSSTPSEDYDKVVNNIEYNISVEKPKQ